MNPKASAVAVAEVVKDWADGSAKAKAFAKLAEDNKAGDGIVAVAGMTELAAGYYLVVDTTAGSPAVYNLALLQLTQKGTFDIASKVSVPDVEKTVNSGLNCDNPGNDHTHTAACYNWAESDKKPIGGEEEFKIEGSIPESVVDYSYYYYIIKDTLSEGLTLDPTSFNVVFVNGTTETAATAADYSLKTGDDAGNYSFQLALTDAKAHAGQKVIVYYKATVNEHALVGVSGNLNTVTVEYSNKPDFEYDDGTTPDGFPDDTTNTPTADTPEDYTLTYVTEISVYKVDEAGHPLKDAEFTLTGETLHTVLVYKEYYVEDPNGTYYKLVATTPNGEDQYTTQAPDAEDHMEVSLGATAGYVIDDDSSATGRLTIGDHTYRPYVPETDADKTVYVLVHDNTALYANTTTKYSKVNTFESQTADGTTYSVSAFVDENGFVKFTGLEAGTYTLSETKVPAGYNPLSDIEFTISWTAPTGTITPTSTCTWSVNEGSAVEYVAETGTFRITVENQKGSTLPETGGIGTQIFYVLGGILLVGAVVLLITKKRMNAKG